MVELQMHEMEGFSLGRPALVCRWRLAGGTLLLANRHMRALSRRIVNGRPITAELVAWAKQHIEWALAEGSFEHPDGLLMLVVDEDGAAAMTVGPFEPLRPCDMRTLIARARGAQREQEATDVVPEALFAHIGEDLLVGISPDAVQGGCVNLVLHLATTLGIPVIFRPDLLDLLDEGALEADGVFLASDEYGIVCASDRFDSTSKKFEGSYQRLFKSAHKKG